MVNQSIFLYNINLNIENVELEKETQAETSIEANNPIEQQ